MPSIKREKINTEPEQNLIIGMIVSDYFIQTIQPILTISNLKMPHSKIVARWCMDYYRQYEKAPKETIQELFKSHQRNGTLDDDNEEIIELFLSVLSERYENYDGFDDHFHIKESEKYLAERKIDSLMTEVKGHLISGNIDQAELTIAKHTRTERPTSTSIDILKNRNELELMFSDDDILLQLSGALGKMIGPLQRTDFFSILAPMKRGKTWWLEELGIMASLRQLKVLFVSLEMPKKKMLQRLYQNFLGESIRPREGIELPYFTDDGDVDYRQVDRKGLKRGAVIKKAESLSLLIRTGGFRLVSYPTYGANIQTIKTEIYNLMFYDNFHPDVIIVDYADILAPEPDSPRNDQRNRINHTWLKLRGLAQETNSIVITASQASRGTFSRDVTEEDTSEDIRKLAHVTHMMTLNQTKEDKKRRIMRVGMIANRNEEFETDDEVVVLYQYAIGKAHLDSRWKKDTCL